MQETFIGEQAVILNVKGKGLVVLSGCAHRGIVNTVRQGQKMTGIEKVHAVIGGFHLIGVKPELIQRTIADFKVIVPDYIVPPTAQDLRQLQLLPGRCSTNLSLTPLESIHLYYLIGIGGVFTHLLSTPPPLISSVNISSIGPSP